MRWKAYPPEVPSVNLDFDWVYRKALPFVVVGTWGLITAMWSAGATIISASASKVTSAAHDTFLGPKSSFGKDVESSVSALWAAVLLVIYLCCITCNSSVL